MLNLKIKSESLRNFCYWKLFVLLFGIENFSGKNVLTYTLIQLYHRHFVKDCFHKVEFCEKTAKLFFF